MVQSVIVYSEIIPTILAVVGIYLIISGMFNDRREVTGAGVVVFLLAVIIPFVILTSLI